MDKTSLATVPKSKSYDYDFTNDTILNKEYLSETDVLKRYFYYRNSSSKTKDPDGYSKKLQQSYIKIYDLNSKYLAPCKKLDGSVWSDTMTSVQTLLSNYCELTCAKDFTKYKNQFKKEKQKFTISVMEYMFKRPSEYLEFKRYVVDNEILKDFIRLYHTIGNYIPVPAGFNMGRSGAGYHDMWDLTLLKIKEYFDLRENNNLPKECLILLKLLHSDASFINTKNWLDSYKSYDEFIEKNHLEFYVQNASKFAALHSWEKPFPLTLENYNDYFKLLSDAITERGKTLYTL